MIRIKYLDSSVEIGLNNDIYSFVCSLFVKNDFSCAELIECSLMIDEKINELLSLSFSSTSLQKIKVEYNDSIIELDRMNDAHINVYFLINLKKILKEYIDSKGKIIVERIVSNV